MRGLSIEVKYFDTVESGQDTSAPTWVAGLDFDISDRDVSELTPEYFGGSLIGLDYYLFSKYGVRLLGIVNYDEIRGESDEVLIGSEPSGNQ
jgi:hypothetical protein